MIIRRIKFIYRLIFSVGISLVMVQVLHAQTGPARSREQVASWEQMKYGMFIHFNMNTFAGAEYDNGKMPAESFNPSGLDVEQWIRTAHDAGMKYAVLTAKHTGGFCLWDSKVPWQGKEYDYDVASSPVRKDIVAMFVRSCRKFDVKPALYYCLWDDHNEKVAGPEAYFQLARGHVEELVKKYQGLVEIWIDIPSRITPGQRIELYNLVKSVQPDCLVTCNNGFTDGTTLSFFPADITNGERTLPPPSGHNPCREIDGQKYYIPMEVCQTINQNWFWLPGDITKSVRSLYFWYNESVKRGANFLLDVPPDTTGRIPGEMADRLMELKKVIGNPGLLPPLRTLTGYKPATASSVFENYAGYLPEYAVDEDPNTRWAAQAGDTLPTLTVDLGEVKEFSNLVLMEPYEPHIMGFKLEYMDGAEWEKVLEGTTVGQELSVNFPAIKAQYIRLVVTKFSIGANPYNAISVPGVPPPEEGVTLSEFQLTQYR